MSVWLNTWITNSTSDYSRQDFQGRQGIYVIWINDKAYVGSTQDLTQRFRKHRQDLHKGKHSNKSFQNAFNKCGDGAVEIGDILFCDGYSPQELVDAEKTQMDQLRANGVKLFNIALDPSANPMVGEGSEQIRQKVSEAQTGHKNHFFGRRHSKSSIQKMSDAKKGNTYALGYKHSEESKQKRRN